jgi:hypothetical protein
MGKTGRVVGIRKSPGRNPAPPFTWGSGAGRSSSSTGRSLLHPRLRIGTNCLRRGSALHRPIHKRLPKPRKGPATKAVVASRGLVLKRSLGHRTASEGVLQKDTPAFANATCRAPGATARERPRGGRLRQAWRLWPSEAPCWTKALRCSCVQSQSAPEAGLHAACTLEAHPQKTDPQEAGSQEVGPQKSGPQKADRHEACKRKGGQ